MQLARLDMRDRARHCGIHQRDGAAQQIGHGLTTTFIGDVREVGTCALLEQFTGNVRRAARAGSAIRQTARLGFRQGNHFFQALGRHTRVRHQNQNGVTDFPDRSKVFCGVKTDFGKHMRVDDQSAVKTQKQGVAIGLGRSHHLRANVARSTRLVVHDHLLAQALGQLFGDQTATGVGHTAGGKGHHQPDRFGRIHRLCSGRARSKSQAGSHARGQQCCQPTAARERCQLEHVGLLLVLLPAKISQPRRSAFRKPTRLQNP